MHRLKSDLFGTVWRGEAGGHENIRHLLEHKRSNCPARLTARERRILATPSAASRTWAATGKRAYTFLTRRVIGWSDREGAGDRQH
ncbi:MAG: hypothetical protein FJ171_01180 [Gammaproteobacteria bacterium]|nr:hypothetical protein [Gammaproteobacteria bacterium]